MRLHVLDNLNLQEYPFAVVNSDVDASAPQRLKMVDRTNADGGRVLSSFLQRRRIKLNMRISADSLDEAEDALDRLKRVQAKGMVHYHCGFREGTRNWEVYVRHIPTSRRGTDISRMSGQILLTAPDPVSTSLAETPLLDTTATADIERTVNYVGTYQALPVITLTYNAIAPNDRAIRVRLDNTSHATVFSFETPINPGDVIVIDCVKRTITLNNSVLIRPFNPFPYFLSSAESLRYSDNATSRNVHINAVYNARWL